MYVHTSNIGWRKVVSDLIGSPSGVPNSPQVIKEEHAVLVYGSEGTARVVVCCSFYIL